MMIEIPVHVKAHHLESNIYMCMSQKTTTSYMYDIQINDKNHDNTNYWHIKS